MDSLRIWDMGPEITGPIICSSDDEELLRVWLSERRLSSPLHIFIVNARHWESVYTISEYISLKHGFKNAVTPSEVEESYFNVWHDILRGDLTHPTNTITSPKIIFKSEHLFSLIVRINSVRRKLLTQTPWCGIKGVYFNHTWWKTRPAILDELEEIRINAQRASKGSAIYQRLTTWVDSVISAIGELRSALLSTVLVTSSAFFFAAAKYAKQTGESDKALLLLHRCVDTYMQYQGTLCRLVSCNDSGLVYTGNDTHDVGYDRTKSKLVDGHHIYTGADLLRLVDRVNFLRNRNFLTHSFYSVADSEMDMYLANVYRFATVMEGGDGKWLKLMKQFLAKPELSEFDLYINEDSFDTYVRHENAI